MQHAHERQVVHVTPALRRTGQPISTTSNILFSPLSRLKTARSETGCKYVTILRAKQANRFAERERVSTVGACPNLLPAEATDVDAFHERGQQAIGRQDGAQPRVGTSWVPGWGSFPARTPAAARRVSGASPNAATTTFALSSSKAPRPPSLAPANKMTRSRAGLCSSSLASAGKRPAWPWPTRTPASGGPS